ncbi:hypothetical protein [Actinacidiphila sp. bgisy144]|uniref:hypothetical protein n=1 Tax=Actinacidiphila sp. bgisy144 TaxID=3413791 RepID=UPI003EBA1EA5
MTRGKGVVLAILALLAFALPSAPASAAPETAPAHAVSAPELAPAWDWWGDTCSFVTAPVLGTAGVAGCKAVAKIIVPGAKKAVTSALNSTVVKPMADGASEFASQILKEGLTWWLTTPSVQVKDSGLTTSETGKGPDGTTVTVSLQAICLGIGEMIAILLLIMQGIRAMIQRKGKPLVDAVQGLVINVVVCTLGIVIIDSMLIASDELTTEIVNVSFHGDSKLTAAMVAMLLPGGFNSMALLLMSLIVVLVGVAQFCALFLRQAAIPIQALLLPIAGAGQIGGEKARQWLPNLYTSIFVVIGYKPMAGLIISAGFVEIANGNSVVDWVRGLVTLIMSILALKALMALFAPLGAAVAGSTSGGIASIAAMVGMGAASERGGNGGGSGAPASAVQHASAMSKGGPAADGAGAAGAAGSGGAAAANPYVAAAQVAMAGKDAAAAAMSGQDIKSDASRVPQQQDGSKGGDSAGGTDGQPGPASPATGGASRATGAHQGVQVAVRAAEANNHGEGDGNA